MVVVYISEEQGVKHEQSSFGAKDLLFFSK